VGSEGDEEHEQTITWTKAHSDEDNLIVASTNRLANDNTPPVNLIAAGVPIQYQITNLLQWAYVNKDPDELLKRLAMREVVRYLASADLYDLMSHGRQKAGEVLFQRIQTAANECQLGVGIIFVGVEDIHPPVAVAKEFEEVINAYQTKEAIIKTAEAVARQTNTMAGAQAARILAEARAERDRNISTADARVSFFNHQLTAYQAAGDVYIQRTYLRSLAKWMDKPRKYVITTTNASKMVQFNLEDKIALNAEALAPSVLQEKKK
jgi:regulator of protease activity HflC (stomatin/prohibitin superfamily)